MNKELYIVFVEERHVDGYVYEHFLGVYKDLDKINKVKAKLERKIFDDQFGQEWRLDVKKLEVNKEYGWIAEELNGEDS